MHGGDWHDGMNGNSWWWMAIMMLVFWGGLIGLGVAFLRRPHHPAPQGSAGSGGASGFHPTAQEILAERLARGEIEVEEFRSRFSALNQPKGP